MAEGTTKKRTTTKDATGTKRKRSTRPVTTASRMQQKSLYASTCTELREVQTQLEKVLQERRELLQHDENGSKSVLKLLAPGKK
ncbi:TPA: hypothetical protein N0F65_008151 [Lagenidium giganteum]|uniref:Uncharacterized protein n=1 Tax=Lagenidium giganteum TaxID=4803 RepID=A0AAV2YHG8_9STRA|nr:TPA: hypothetical protein N0F65_008151 [Lagenidium giganteum]